MPTRFMVKYVGTATSATTGQRNAGLSPRMTERKQAHKVNAETDENTQTTLKITGLILILSKHTQTANSKE